MTIATILTSLEDYMKPLVQAEDGILSVVETVEDLIEALGGNAPEKWRVVLSTDGEKAPEPTGRGGHVVNEITVYVQAPRGMDAKPSKSLHRKATNNRPAFLERLSWVIRKLRAVRFDHPEIDGMENLNYRGWEWLKYQDVPDLRTAKLTFELLYVADDPTTELPLPDPVLTPGTPSMAIVGSYLHLTLDGETKRVRLLDLA